MRRPPPSLRQLFRKSFWRFLGKSLKNLQNGVLKNLYWEFETSPWLSFEKQVSKQVRFWRYKEGIMYWNSDRNLWEWETVQMFAFPMAGDLRTRLSRSFCQVRWPRTMISRINRYSCKNLPLGHMTHSRKTTKRYRYFHRFSTEFHCCYKMAQRQS